MINENTDQFLINLYFDFEEATPLAFGYGERADEGEWRLDVPASSNECLLAAWALLLSRYTGHSRVSIGFQAEGDAEPRPIRLEIKEDQSTRSFLSSIRSQCARQTITDAELRSLLMLEPNRSFYTCVVDGCCGVRGAGTYSGKALADVASHLECILSGLSGNGMVLDIAHLSSTEHQLVIEQWNPPQTVYPESTVHSLFEDQVSAQPDKVALNYLSHAMTYGELNSRANALAHLMIAEGVKPGQSVGIFLDRGFDQIVSTLAVLKAGGIYIPLDTEFPAERIFNMLEDARPAAILSDSRVSSRLVGFDGVKVISIDGMVVALDAQPRHNPIVDCGCDSLAYIMYTSGSTGRPKGVEIYHRGIIRLLFGVEYVPLNSETVILHMAAVSFDASTFEIWGALLHGGTCVLSDSRVPTLDVIGHLLDAHKVNTFWMTAALFNLVITEAPEILRPIKYLLAGGEALSPRHVEKALNELPDVKLINGYGPTENTTFSTTHTFERDTYNPEDTIPIGRAIGNSTCYILDRLLRPVPIGVPGELYVGGDGLARGYANRPDLTEERFVNFSPDGGENKRVYKTGDMAYWNRAGQIEFLGRADHQIKLRGFRIELQDIDLALGSFPEVEQAVTVVYEDDVRGKWLAGFVKVEDPEEFPVSELEKFAYEKLPDYMVPSVLVPVREWSYTPSGKLDRNALPKPQLFASRTDFLPPETETEKILVKIWGKLLQIEQVGVGDSFFELGGDSLRGVQLFHEIHQQFGCDLALSKLTQQPTIRGLARIIDADPVSPQPGSARSLQIMQHGNPDITPLLMIHGGAGNVILFREFIENLGTSQPVYAFQWPGWDGCRGGHSIKSMALAYKKELLNYRPLKKYRLGGHCIGGIIAIELARELRRDGIEIEGPIIVSDGPNLNASSYRSVEPELTAGSLKAFNVMNGMLHAKQYSSSGEIAPPAHVHQPVAGLTGKVKSMPMVIPVVRSVRNAPAVVRINLKLAMGQSVPIEQRAFYAINSLVKAAKRHRATGYDGDILYFRSACTFGREMGLQGWWDDCFMGFAELCDGNFAGHVLGGGHDDPLCNPLAAKLVKQCFEDLDK